MSPASFVRRAGSHLIDAVLAPVLVLTAGLVRARHPALALGVFLLGWLAFAVFAVWNSGYRQGRTGQSVGRRALGTRLVGTATGRPVGFGRRCCACWPTCSTCCRSGSATSGRCGTSGVRHLNDKVCDTVVVVADRPAGGP